MMLTCAKCGRKHPLSDDDVVNFYPRFFCLSCGTKLPFEMKESELQALRGSNDRNRKVTDLAGLPPQDQFRKVVKSGDESSGGGG